MISKYIFNLIVNTRSSGYGKCLIKDIQTVPNIICENLIPNLNKVNALINDIFTSCTVIKVTCTCCN